MLRETWPGIDAVGGEADDGLRGRCAMAWAKPRKIPRIDRARVSRPNPRIMPKKEIRHPDKEKSTGAYSSAVEIDGWVYVSGLGPVDPKTSQPVPGSVEEE